MNDAKYEEFRGTLLEKLKMSREKLGYSTMDYYEKGFTSEDAKELEIIRNTNIRYHKTECDTLLGDYILLYLSDEDRYACNCRFSCQYLYEDFEEEGWDGVWEIITANLDMCRKNASLDIMQMIDENDYEALKERIFIRLLNFNDHRYELKENHYRRIGDIVQVLYLMASDEHGEDGRHDVYSIKLPKHLSESWNLSEEELWENAMANTYLMAPPRMYLNPMDTADPPYHKGAFMALNSDIKSLPATSVPVVTTTSQMNGAIAIFYPGVMERIAELFGGDYYVAFTSIHDLRIHKKGTIPPIHILRRVRDTNRAFPADETLSRKVYLYERDSKTFKQLEL